MRSRPEIEQALSGLIEQCFDGVAVWSATPWRVVFSNDAFGRLMRFPTVFEPPADPLWSLKHASRGELLEQMDRLADRSRDGHGAESTQLHVEMADGSSCEVRLCCTEHDGERAIGMIVRQVALPPAGNGQPRRDPLTGLADREFLLDRIGQLLDGGIRTGGTFAVLFLDLDGFKQANDEFGHLRGDDVLREAARRIAACVRDGDVVARYGGDEFVIVLDGISSADEVEPIIARIRAALAKPIALAGEEFVLSATVGVAFSSEGTATAEELLAIADRAMYASKRAT